MNLGVEQANTNAVSVPPRESRMNLSFGEFGMLVINVSVIVFIVWSSPIASPKLKFLPSIVVVVLAIAVRIKGKQLGKWADQLYFLGYLSTITTFLAIAWQVCPLLERPQNPGEPLIPPSMVLFGVAGLSSTVAGLIAMNFLRWSDDDAGAGISLNAPLRVDWNNLFQRVESSQEILRLLKGVRAALIDQVKVAAVEAATSLKTLNAGIVKLSSNVQSLQDKTDSLKDSIDNANTSAKTFKDAVDQMRSVLDDYVRITQINLASLEDES